MRFEATDLPLAAVDRRDTFYRISDGAPQEPLSDSIARIGLLTPPLVVADGQRHMIISGFRRLAVCADLGWERIPVYCLPSSVSAVDRAVMAIDAKRLHRPLTPMETARALRLLDTVSDHSDHWRHLAEQLALPSRSAVMSQWRRLADAPEVIQTAVENDSLAFPMAQRLLDLDPADAIAVAHLFVAAHFSLNKQRECLDWIEDIARRDGRPVGDIVSDDRIQSVLADTDDRGQIGHRLRVVLRRWRFPTIVGMEETQKRLLAVIPLGENAKLTPPAHFEGSRYWLTLGFDSIQSLVAHHHTLDAVANAQALRQLMDGVDPGIDDPS